MRSALVTGAGGQLGIELVRRAPAGMRIAATTSAELDVGDAAAVEAALAGLRPDVVLNAAAYTAVDLAEREEEKADRVNHLGVRHLAAACRKHGARLVHVSTDYVFDGRASEPCAPDAPVAPQSAYGRTKLAGERAALELEGALVVRTAWVYSAHGRNFMKTMIRLMEERPEVRVVADQVGSPTAAHGLADALWRLAAARESGIHHWTDAGVASWYDFACAIREESAVAGFATGGCRVVPIRTADYPTPARRPAMGVLAKDRTYAALGGPAAHWREALRVVLREYREVSRG